MPLMKEQEKIYKKYKFTGMTEETFLEIFALAQKEENKNITLKMILNKYLKENLTFEHVLNFLGGSHFHLEESSKRINYQLRFFYNMLDTAEYILTPEEVKKLLEKEVFMVLCSKFVSNRKKIFQQELEAFINNNTNLESIIMEYLEQNKITIIEEEFEIGEENQTDLDTLQLYLEEINRVPLLSYEETTELAKRKDAGEIDAKKRLAEANLRLVVNRAKTFQGKELPLQDLIQEGNLGLIKAIKKFDWKKGYAFSTYANWWIRQAIQRGLANTSRTIRIPVAATNHLIKIKKIKERFLKNLGREPSLDELAKEMNISKKTIKDLLDAPQELSSLNECFGEEQDSVLEEVLADENSLFEESLTDDMNTKKILEILPQVITKREYEVLMLRFGMHGKKLTLEATGEIFNVTKERIRQIEAKALRKAREDEQIKQYNPFYDSKKEEEMLINLMNAFKEKDSNKKKILEQIKHILKLKYKRNNPKEKESKITVKNF